MSTENSAVIARLESQRDELAEALRSTRFHVCRQRLGEACAQINCALANLDSEPERKKDNDMTHDYDRDIHTNPDHEAWADFFIKTWPNGCADRDTMAGWFANAMMAKADSTISEKAEQPAVPGGWSVEERDNTYLILKHDANGEFVKGEWIEPEQHGHVICELLSDMAQQKGRE